ncbi:hypothetical protein, partial [Escherichia coli]
RFIRTVLHTMKLDGLFPIFDSLDAAVGQLQVAVGHDADAVDVVPVDVTPADVPRPAAEVTPRVPTARRRPVSRVSV